LGFTSPQFDLIRNRFIPRRIKALDVICTQDAQAFGSSNTSSAFADALRDPDTGELVPNRALVATINDMFGSVGLGKVFNRYRISVSLIDTTTNEPVGVAAQLVVVDDEVTCPAARPGDILQKKDIQPNATFAVDIAPPFGVTLFVWVTSCVIVARETILKVRAAKFFCR